MTDRSHPVAQLGSTIRSARSTRARVYEHKLVLYEKIGPGKHLCHWCSLELEWKAGVAGDTLIADHLNGDQLDNRPENLVPSCNGCNTIRARTNWRPQIMEGELVIYDKSGNRTRAVECTCEWCGQVFLAHAARVARGTVRFCSNSCTGKSSAHNRWHT